MLGRGGWRGRLLQEAKHRAAEAPGCGKEDKQQIEDLVPNTNILCCSFL